MSFLPLIPIFIFGAVALGAGAMLAPALPLTATTVRQNRAPRVGLAAALALAFVVDGALFLAALFGWDTLTIDYLWFALVVGIFLTGTLALGTSRGEEAGLRDRDLGWPGVRELVFFGLVLLLVIVPVLVLPVPLDTDAQGFGTLALSLRDSGSLTTLAPFHPEIEYLVFARLPGPDGLPQQAALPRPARDPVRGGGGAGPAVRVAAVGLRQRGRGLARPCRSTAAAMPPQRRPKAAKRARCAMPGRRWP